jgi:hypothetical protein
MVIIIIPAAPCPPKGADVLTLQRLVAPSIVTERADQGLCMLFGISKYRTKVDIKPGSS